MMSLQKYYPLGWFSGTIFSGYIVQVYYHHTLQRHLYPFSCQHVIEGVLLLIDVEARELTLSILSVSRQGAMVIRNQLSREL